MAQPGATPRLERASLAHIGESGLGWPTTPARCGAAPPRWLRLARVAGRPPLHPKNLSYINFRDF
jgi:hypothetical protein